MISLQLLVWNRWFYTYKFWYYVVSVWNMSLFCHVCETEFAWSKTYCDGQRAPEHNIIQQFESLSHLFFYLNYILLFFVKVNKLIKAAASVSGDVLYHLCFKSDFKAGRRLKPVDMWEISSLLTSNRWTQLQFIDCFHTQRCFSSLRCRTESAVCFFFFSSLKRTKTRVMKPQRHLH